MLAWQGGIPMHRGKEMICGRASAHVSILSVSVLVPVHDLLRRKPFFCCRFSTYCTDFNDIGVTFMLKESPPRVTLDKKWSFHLASWTKTGSPPAVQMLY